MVTYVLSMKVSAPLVKLMLDFYNHIKTAILANFQDFASPENASNHRVLNFALPEFFNKRHFENVMWLISNLTRYKQNKQYLLDFTPIVPVLILILELEAPEYWKDATRTLYNLFSSLPDLLPSAIQIRGILLTIADANKLPYTPQYSLGSPSAQCSFLTARCLQFCSSFRRTFLNTPLKERSRDHEQNDLLDQIRYGTTKFALKILSDIFGLKDNEKIEIAVELRGIPTMLDIFDCCYDSITNDDLRIALGPKKISLLKDMGWEALFCLSNLCAGPAKWVEIALSHKVLDRVDFALQCDHADLRKEALWCVANILNEGTESQILTIFYRNYFKIILDATPFYEVSYFSLKTLQRILLLSDRYYKEKNLRNICVDHLYEMGTVLQEKYASNNPNRKSRILARELFRVYCSDAEELVVEDYSVGDGDHNTFIGSDAGVNANAPPSFQQHFGYYPGGGDGSCSRSSDSGGGGEPVGGGVGVGGGMFGTNVIPPSSSSSSSSTSFFQ